MSRATAQDLIESAMVCRGGRAIRFYAETLEMTIAYRSDEMGWAQMAPGEGQLALERVAPSDQEGRALVGRFVGVSLQVPDIFATYKHWPRARGRLRRPTGEAAVG